MSFVSLQFIGFLLLVFALYWAIGGGRRRAQNALLVVASVVFYGWVEWRFTGLLLTAGLTSWGAGRLMERAGKRMTAVAFWGAISVNMGILAAFKYFDFFAENFAALFRSLGWGVDAVTLGLVLPVGISFYTFQAVSYVIDVRRSTVAPCRNVVDYLAFLCFFPQLVAGPIERATSLLPQIGRQRRFDRALAVDGMRQLLWGYVKKVVVADSCAVMVDQTWHNVSGADSAQLWLTAILFALQIYGDFSGYSDIAIGCGKLFGIRLRRNFANPFFSLNMAQLWRRWHMSLMAWLRDYVYIPLGGSRCSRARWMVNVLVVFAVSGIWHGAAWTFVAWGVFNGVCVVVCSRKRLPDEPVCRSLTDAARMAATFALFAFGFVLFRAPSLGEAVIYIKGMFSLPSAFPYGMHALAYGAAMLAVEWVMRRREHGLQLAGHGVFSHRAARWAVYYALAMTVAVFYLSSQQVAFIYFRF